MKSIKLLLLSIAAILMPVLWLGAGTLPVAAAQAKSIITLTYEIQTDRQGTESLVLTAKVTRDDGYPLSERSIAFFEMTDLFGIARMPIGSATTSAVGIASLKYETRQAGEHKFTAVYSGDETTASAIVDATLDIQELPALGPLSPPVGMENISEWSMIAAGVVVLAVWGLLVGVFAGTVKGIRAGNKQQ